MFFSRIPVKVISIPHFFLFSRYLHFLDRSSRKVRLTKVWVGSKLVFCEDSSEGNFKSSSPSILEISSISRSFVEGGAVDESLDGVEISFCEDSSESNFKSSFPVLEKSSFSLSFVEGARLTKEVWARSRLVLRGFQRK